MLLLIMLLPPHHHHGGVACFAADVHENHEGACPDPEHHCDDVPDAADHCLVYLQSAYLHSSKAGIDDDPQQPLHFDALLSIGLSVVFATESPTFVRKPYQAFVSSSPENALFRRGPPVWG